jgi:TonB family protein
MLPSRRLGAVALVAALPLAAAARTPDGAHASRPGRTAAQPSDSNTVQGVVRGPGGAAVAGAEVTITPPRPPGGVGIVNAKRVYTGDDGRFRLVGLPAGANTLVVRRLGYRPATRPLALPLAGGEPVVVALEQIPQQVAAVVVRERHRGPYTGWLRDFHRRRDMGFGRFLSRGDIDARNAMRTTDLVRTIPGAMIHQPGVGPAVVRFRNSGCDPLVWIDGAPATAGYLDIDAFQPNSLDGIEVYSGPATVPVELRGPRGEERCGVIALWTRMPEPRRRSKKTYTAEDLARFVETATVFTVDQVDRPAQPDTARPVMPVYPDSLKRFRVAGEALVEFVVDTTGQAEIETLSIVSATHPAFGRAAREAVPPAAFVPAVKAGRPVRQLMQLPVRFEPGR